MNYNTFAMMNWHGYKRLVQDFPEYEACLMRHVVDTYYDHRIKFVATMIKRIEYLDLVPIEILYELIFSLQSKTIEKGGIVLDVDQLIEAIYFVDEGMVEVSTEFENNEFIIDKLGPGSAINYRALFLRD